MFGFASAGMLPFSKSENQLNFAKSRNGEDVNP